MLYEVITGTVAKVKTGNRIDRGLVFFTGLMQITRTKGKQRLLQKGCNILVLPPVRGIEDSLRISGNLEYLRRFTQSLQRRVLLCCDLSYNFV